MIEYNITGYAGFYDYDGRGDDNINIKVKFPDSLSEKEVLDIYFRKYNRINFREVVLRIESKTRVE